MAVISQGMTLPGNVATAETIQATDVSALYAKMNAFTIPDTIGVWQQGIVDTTLYTVATGVNQDWTVTVAKEKAIQLMVSFAWSGAAAAPTLTFRLNAAAVTAAVTFAGATATGNGLLRAWIGGHDTTDVPRPAIWEVIESNATTAQQVIMPNANLPNVDTTSIGVAIGGAGNTFKFKYLKIWKEG